MKPDLQLLNTDPSIMQDLEAPPAMASTAADSPEMIFVTGASRSGTSMLARMLGAHSSIMAFDELHYFGGLWDPFDTNRQFSAPDLSELAAELLARHSQGLWGGSPTEVERAWGRRLVRDMPNDQCTPSQLFVSAVTQIAKDAGKSIPCEQTPRNIFYADRLFEMYPNAKIVHIIRDPRAVLASQKNRWKLRRMGAHHLPASEMLRNRVNYHPITMGQLWSKAQAIADRLEHHPRFFLMRFEDLAADPETNTRRMCDFLGLEFESEMLDVPRWGSSNVEHSTESKGVSSEVIDKWRDSLSQGEIQLNEKVTKDMMERFGYAPAQLEKAGSLATLPSLLSYPFHIAGIIAMNPRRAFVQLAAMLHSKRSQDD